MSKSTNTTPPAATDTVYHWLQANPGWHTVKDIDASLDGAVTRASIRNHLKQLWDADKIRRHVGATDLARGKNQPDTWSAREQDTQPPTVTTQPTSAAAAPSNTAITGAEATGKQEKQVESSSPAESSPGTPSHEGTDAASTTPSDDTAKAQTEPATSSPTQQAPAAPVTMPDTRVIAVAGVLNEHHNDGLSAVEVATAAGLALGVAWKVLLAMRLAGAAVCDAEFVLADAARWRPGAAHPGQVAVDQAPATVSCPTCGTDARIPGRKTARRRSIDGLCFDGAPPLAQGALAQQVRDYVTAHPGDTFTPGQVTKALDARSSGAVLNVLVKLAATTDLVVEDHHAPHRTFRATDHH